MRQCWCLGINCPSIVLEIENPSAISRTDLIQGTPQSGAHFCEPLLFLC